MKAEKNSFILYYDFRDQTAHLTDEQLGRFMRGLLDYEIDRTTPKFNDPYLDTAFLFVKVILDNNRAKYEAKCEKNKINGAQGGRPKGSVAIPNAGKGFNE